jgi:hypothetical protein
MASLDSLPADQKAVLSLVLQRGRSFDQIAQLLSIDRAAVRQRALEGFDALGPETTLEPLKRALITDYLLGQLPEAVATNVANSLANNPSERAWARVVAAEIAPLAADGLPEIPAAAAAGAVAVAPAPTPPATPAGAGAAAPAGAGATAADHAATTPAAATSGAATSGAATSGAATSGAAGSGAPRSSRRGGAILLGLIVVVVVVVVVVLLVSGGSNKKHPAARVVQTPPSTTTTEPSGTATGVTPLHQMSLVSPTSVKGREGAAAVVRASGKIGLVLAAEGLPANTDNAYAVWLYNAKSQASDFLGFYPKKVAATGKTKGDLTTEVSLPSDATEYNELLVTIETTKPTKPGTIVLEGSFAE